MSQFWEQRLDNIREQLAQMASLTERNVGNALRALTERSNPLCDEVEAADEQIDHRQMRVDEMVVTFMATHAPTACDCRMMLTASKISSNLERIADEATKIARRARLLNAESPLEVAQDIPMLGETAREMLRDSMTAFLEANNDLAVEVIARDRSVDSINKQIERELLLCMEKNTDTVGRALHLMTITRAIERMADHATNIAEEAFYFYKAEDIRHVPALKGNPPSVKA